MNEERNQNYFVAGELYHVLTNEIDKRMFVKPYREDPAGHSLKIEQFKDDVFVLLDIYQINTTPNYEIMFLTKRGILYTCDTIDDFQNYLVRLPL